MTDTACPSTPFTATPRAGTRGTAIVRAAWRRWRDHRDVLIPVGPEPAGPWVRTDRPDRDRIRMLAELSVAPASS